MKRVGIGFAVAAMALELAAIVMYAAAAGFAPGLSVEPSRLIASGSAGAALIRWGSLADMMGYLCIAPVVFYLRDRFGMARYGDLIAAAGLAVVVIGSMGAAAMAVAAPVMITSYMTAGAASKQALVPAFATLYRVVVLGLWQTLETIPATVWLLGTAAAAGRGGHRSATVILVVLGLSTAAIALYRLA